jgi:hypothetical protein
MIVVFAAPSFWNRGREHLEFTSTACINLLGTMLMQSRKCILCYASKLYLTKN